jgi:hypothetical protein
MGYSGRKQLLGWPSLHRHWRRGFGGVGNQFSLLNIPIVVYGWIPYPSDLPGVGVGDLPPDESATANTYSYWGPIQVGSGFDIDWGWYRTFATEFFRLSGGPGNVPTCAGQALGDIADDVLNPVPTEPSAADAGKLAAAYGAAVQYNRTYAYAAARGLTFPQNSRVFGKMLEGSRSLAEETGVGSIAVATSFSAGYRTYTTSAAARNGGCAAALPIF